MSKYLHFASEVYTNRRLLVSALADLGFSEVEEGEALPLYGYEGSRRAETAELIVRRRFVGAAANDLGFRRTPEGYAPVISEYDQRTLLEGRFLVRLRTAYSEQAIGALALRLRGSVERSIEGGLVKVRVRF